MSDWKIGDVVSTKSGGLPMTVEAVHGVAEQVSCVWFDLQQQLQRSVFHKDSLEAAPDERP